MSGDYGSELLLAALDEAAVGVAMMTGVKQQYIDAGWSEHVAEFMVLEHLRKAAS